MRLLHRGSLSGRLSLGVVVLIAAASITPAASAAPAAARTRPAVASPGDWPAYLADASHSSYNADATSITPDNESGLRQMWRWIVPPSPNAGSTLLTASPVVVNGVVYIGAEDGYFYALDEATRQVLWSDFLGLVTKLTCPGTIGITSTATVADDPVTGNATVYVNAPDGYLYALDAATGAVNWRSVVAIPSTTKNDYYAWGSPLVTGGKVYVGISSNCDNPLIQGGALAFDQATGTQLAHWRAITGKFGASVWSSPGVTADGRIIVTTGNGYKPSGQPLYDDSVVALDPNTLNVLDYWQVPASERIADGDFGASPTMFTADINGVSTPMLGVCNKNGTYYALQQDNLAAGPVWQDTITVPYPGGAKECVAAAIWNGTDLIEGGGAATTINGTTFDGSVQALDPATGTVIWQTGLNGTIVGSPTEDGGGVVAAQTYQSSTNQMGVYLLNASTGAILAFIPTPHSHLFGQPVFAQQDLLIGAGPSLGLTAYEATTPGPPITNVSPATIGDGTSDTLTLTGSGFTGSPEVLISGSGVTVGTVTVTSPTQLTVNVTVSATAPQTARHIDVIQPGSPPLDDSCSACLTIGPQPLPPAPGSISPDSFAAGTKNMTATMTGANFEPGAVITSHAGMNVTATFVSSTQLNLLVTVSATAAPGTYNLWVRNPDGLRGECAGCLTVTSP